LAADTVLQNPTVAATHPGASAAEGTQAAAAIPAVIPAAAIIAEMPTRISLRLASQFVVS
jgi:hypothetical protein